MQTADRRPNPSRQSRFSRRRFLSLSALALGSLGAGTSLLAACAPASAPPAPTAAPPKPTSPPAAPATSARAPTAVPKTEAPKAEAPKPAPPTAAPAAAPPRRPILVWGGSSDASRLNPQLSNQFLDTAIYDSLYDQLTRRAPDMSLVPGLATEWKLVDDTTWQFKLRPNVKFHNGDPFTAADVKFTIERTYDPEAKTQVATIFTTVERVDVVDDLTVNFIMKNPDPLLPARHADRGGYIMPKKYFETAGPEGFERRPIGTGPFKFNEWVKDDRLVLDAYQEYWGGAPNVDGVVLRPKPEAASRVAALLAGDVDFIDEVRPDAVEQITRDASSKVEAVPAAGFAVVVVNVKVPPLDRQPLRQAMSLAIDREAIVRELLRGQGVVPNGSITKGDFAYDPSLPPLPFDAQKAKQLIQQAGYNGDEVVYETIDADRAVAEVIVAMWKDVGINAKIELLEVAVRAQKLRDRSFKGVFSGNTVSTLGDPDGLLWRLLAPDASWNYWRNPEYDRLGQESRFSFDQDKRKANYQRMNQLLLEEVPWMPLYQPLRAYAMRKSIQWRPIPTSRVEFRKENLSVTS